MKLHFKEDPKEWRKMTLLGLVGPTVLLCILRWRGVVTDRALALVLGLFAMVALCAFLQPRWFRGYYRFATRLGFYTIQIFGKIVLTLVFFLIVTPLGWIMRLSGKDLLQLKSRPHQQTFWRSARQDGSFDQMY